MKTRFVPGPLLLSLLLATGAAGRAQTVPPAPVAPRELAIVVVESLERHAGGFSDFNRIDLAFTDVLKQRKWPVTLKVERFAANTPAHDLELRIYYQGIRSEIPGELTFRAWMTFTDHGRKHDFGIVRFRYDIRAGEPNEVMLENIFRGAANAAADQIEPLLFPKPAAPKS